MNSAAAPKSWFVHSGERQDGPFPTAEIIRLVALGELRSDVHVWSEGMSDWAPIQSVEELKPVSRPAPAKSVAPPPFKPKAAALAAPREKSMSISLLTDTPRENKTLQSASDSGDLSAIHEFRDPLVNDQTERMD